MTDDVRFSLERLAERGAPRGAEAVLSAVRRSLADGSHATLLRRDDGSSQASRRPLVVVACGVAAAAVLAALAFGLHRDDVDSVERVDAAPTLECTVTVGSEKVTTALPITNGSTAELTVAGYLTKFRVGFLPSGPLRINLSAVITDPSGLRLLSTVGGVNPDADAGPAGDIPDLGYHFECVPE